MVVCKFAEHLEQRLDLGRALPTKVVSFGSADDLYLARSHLPNFGSVLHIRITARGVMRVHKPSFGAPESERQTVPPRWTCKSDLE